MKETFRAVTNSIIGSNLVAAIIALILIFSPATIVSTLGIVVGILLLAWGAFMLFLESRSSLLFRSFGGLFIGVISIALGVALLSNPTSLSVILLFSVGIWVILSSLYNLRLAFTLKHADRPNWFKVAVFAVLDLVIGVLVVMNPFESVLSITVFIGFALLFHSLLSIIDVLFLRRDTASLEAALKGVVREAEIIEDKTQKESSKTHSKTSSKSHKSRKA